LNECIILRGVGGFETSYKHAELDKNKKVLSPPSKQVHFHPEWKNDNGVLEQHIAKSLNIDTAKASELIDDFVKDFYRTLDEKGTVIMEGVGEFRKDPRSKLDFRELKDANYLADSFGLDVLDLISEEIEEPQKPKEKPLVPVKQNKRKLTILYIFIGVLLLVISVTLIIILMESGGADGFKIFNRKKGENKTLVLGKRSKVGSDSVSRSIEKKIDSKTSARKALSLGSIDNTIAPVDEKPVVTRGQFTYYLIAGSFKTHTNAEVHKNRLAAKGINAEIIPMGNNIRVIVGSFYNENEAQKEMERLNPKVDIWLLKKRN
jgi:nucleoid DNA-binding protein